MALLGLSYGKFRGKKARRPHEMKSLKLGMRPGRAIIAQYASRKRGVTDLVWALRARSNGISQFLAGGATKIETLFIRFLAGGARRHKSRMKRQSILDSIHASLYWPKNNATT